MACLGGLPEAIEERPALAAVGRDQEIEIATIGIAARLGGGFDLPRIEFPSHGSVLAHHTVPTMCPTDEPGLRQTLVNAETR